MALYKGAGGVEWEITPPDEGTQQREDFDRKVENGELVLIDEPKPAKAAATKKAAAS